MQNIYRLVEFLGSRTFLILVLVLFALGAGWIAIAGRYPLVFDEKYHLGLIKLHASQWSPLLTHQPPGPATYGAVTRDPSYMYHYLASFPYRLLNAFKLHEWPAVVALRLINVGLFAIGLLLFKKLFAKTKVSPALVNVALLFFVLTPVVPFLAANLGYDSLEILLMAYALLLTVKFKASLDRRKLDLAGLGLLLTVSLVATLVKFTYLPMLLILTLYLVVIIYRAYRRNPQKLGAATRRAWQLKPWWQWAIIVTAIFVSLALFLQSYGVNVIKYKNPVPQCGQVLNVEQCSAYHPWYRNYLIAQYDSKATATPFRYGGAWLIRTVNSLFFTYDGKVTDTDGYERVTSSVPIAAMVVSTVAFVLVCIYARRLLKADRVLTTLLYISLVYMVFVWGRNYHDYMQLGKILAVNGRYIVPVILPVYVLMAQCYQMVLTKYPAVKVVLLSLVVAIFVQGGVLTSPLTTSVMSSDQLFNRLPISLWQSVARL